VVNLSHPFELAAVVMILVRQWAESNWPDPLFLDVRPHLLNISRARAWLLPVRGQKFGHGLLIERNGLYYLLPQVLASGLVGYRRCVVLGPIHLITAFIRTQRSRCLAAKHSDGEPVCS
jgi:hypothetical protein